MENMAEPDETMKWELEPVLAWTKKDKLRNVILGILPVQNCCKPVAAACYRDQNQHETDLKVKTRSKDEGFYNQATRK